MNTKADKIQELMDEAYDIWKSKPDFSREDLFDLISFKHKAAVVLGNLNYQVENGGFVQWISNGYCLNMNDLKRVLRKFLKWENDGFADAKKNAQQVLDMLTEIEQIIDLDAEDRGCGGSYLINKDEDAGDGPGPWLDKFDTKFYSINEALFAGLDAWFKSENFQ